MRAIIAWGRTATNTIVSRQICFRSALLSLLGMHRAVV
jgi:hypothetical protein